MSDELLVSVKVPIEDGYILVEENDCFDVVSIFYSENGKVEAQLPSLTKSQWTRLKRAGDYVFGEIIGE